MNGLLNINKPEGVTSYWVVNRVKKILGIEKVGHCGTLDPMASGVLLVLFGSATKKQDLLMSNRKIYRAQLTLGIKTDTGDTTGKVIEKMPVPVLSKERITEVFDKFMGDIRQLTPIFSAVRYKGSRMYELARKGVEMLRPPRIVSIYSLEILGFDKDKIEFVVECSSGTYIRSLCEDIGKALGGCAAMSALIRQQIGGYSLSSAINGEILNDCTKQQLLALSQSV